MNLNSLNITVKYIRNSLNIFLFDIDNETKL